MHKEKMVAATTGLVVCLVSTAVRADGPFGITMGSDISPFNCQKMTRPGVYECAAVPRPHPAFQMYLVQYHPTTGICWVKGAGNTIESNSFGNAIESAVDDIEEQLEVTYGVGEKYDVLFDGSIWKAPEDWMMSLLKGERLYSYSWKGRKLPNDVDELYLAGEALDRDTGFVVVEFSFKNKTACDEHLKKEAAKAF